jgi:hypothetical protein
MSISFVKLDRRSIRLLKPGEKISEHGITAERLADRDIRYSVNYSSPENRPMRVPAGCHCPRAASSR